MEQEKLKELLGDSYKEGMTDDEAITLLAQLRSDEASKYSKDRASFDKTATELANLKKKVGENLTEAEKQKELFDQIKNENETLKKERDISTYTSKYIALGYDEKLAKETAEAQVNGDMTKVFEYQQKFLKTHEEKLRADLLKGTPRPNPNDPNNGEITQEQFNKMSLAERTKLYTEQPDLYNSFKNGR